MLKTKYYRLDDAPLARGVVVVIDVLRAFTTAAYAFNSGAAQIYPVGTVHQALNLRKQLPAAAVMGEVEGRKPEGFDFSNSPAEIFRLDLTGKPLIQRTSAGTQGIVGVQSASVLLAASFVVAKATAKFLHQLEPSRVSFVITGQSLGRDGEEDLACAEYIQALLDEKTTHLETYISRVMGSSVGQAYQSGQLDYLSEEDIQLSLAVNRFNFCLPVTKLDGQLCITRRWV